MAGYTREFLVDAYLWRFLKVLSIEKLIKLEQDAYHDYDKYGKEKFRQYASLDSEYIKKYKESLK